MDSVKQGIDKYRSAIAEYFEQSQLEDAAMNIRYILELILAEYVKRFAPEYVYAKAIDKITKLTELKIIDEISENSLHQMRKLGNRAAHKDENLPISKEEIEIILPVIDLEINSLINRIREIENAENAESDTQRPFSEEWVLSLYNSSNTISEVNHLISTLEKYPEEQTREFIDRCKEKKQEIYKRIHAKEIYLDEIKKKNFYPANKLIAIDGGALRARSITGSDVLLPKGAWVNSVLQLDMKVITWKNVKKTRKNYALFYDGKIGVAYSDKKSEYISDYTYGIWDNIVDFEPFRKHKEDKDYVFAVTDSGKVKTNDWRCKLKAYYTWENICKIYVDDFYCLETPDILIGIEKDGTVHVTNQYNICDADWDELYLNLSKIKNICDIQFLSGSIYVLTTDGKVIEFTKGTWSEKLFSGLEDWEDIIQIRVEHTHILGLKSNGTVVGIKANNADVRKDCCFTENWTNIVAIFSSTNLSIGLKTTGEIVSCGKDSEKYNSRICYNVFKFEEECEKWKQRNQLVYKIEKIKKSYNFDLQKLKNELSQVNNQIVSYEQKINSLYEEKDKNFILFCASGILDIPYLKKQLKKISNQKDNIVNELNSIQYQIDCKIKPYQEEIEEFDKMLKEDESELYLQNEDFIEE